MDQQSDTRIGMDTFVAETVADARWFPLRYDMVADRIQFIWLTADDHQKATFLSELRPAADEVRSLARADVAAAAVQEGPLHFILHSGLAGSTLLARALAQDDVVTTLKEPPILTDVIAFGLQAPVSEGVGLRGLVTRLLARPFAPGAAVVVKMSSIGNGLVAPMAQPRSSSRILCLHAPLETMLASLAKRGLEGRLAGRKLFIGLRNAGLGELGFTGKQLFEHSDLQLAALAWLAIQRLINQAGSVFGSKARSVSSDDLIGRPGEVLSAIAAHLGIALDVEERLASGIFDRHSKTGEPFDAGVREKEIAGVLSVHGREIRAVGEWMTSVALAKSISMEAPNPLLS